jgi:hypothetical protein
VDQTTIEEAPARPAWRSLRRRQVAALSLIAVAVVMAIWGTPSTVSEAYFGASVAGGGVTSWEIDAPRSQYGLEVATGLSVTKTSGGESGTVIWTDTRGRLHRTDVQILLGQPDPNRPEDQELTNPAAGVFWSNGYQVDLGATVAATAAAGGSPVPEYGLGAARFLGLPLAALALVSVLMLIFGPQPRRRTKWGTFWMLGIPAGVGLVWWVLTDSPWSAASDALPEPAPRQRGPVLGVVDRRGGGTMFLIAFALSIVVGFGWMVLRLLPGAADYGDPQAGTVVWHVVWSTGHTGTYQP